MRHAFQITRKGPVKGGDLHGVSYRRGPVRTDPYRPFRQVKFKVAKSAFGALCNFQKLFFFKRNYCSLPYTTYWPPLSCRTRGCLMVSPSAVHCIVPVAPVTVIWVIAPTIFLLKSSAVISQS